MLLLLLLIVIIMHACISAPLLLLLLPLVKKAVGTLNRIENNYLSHVQHRLRGQRAF